MDKVGVASVVGYPSDETVPREDIRDSKVPVVDKVPDANESPSEIDDSAVGRAVGDDKKVSMVGIMVEEDIDTVGDSNDSILSRDDNRDPVGPDAVIDPESPSETDIAPE